MKPTIHVAGPMQPDGLQLCTRCGEVVTDYRNTEVPDGTPPLRGFEPGRHIVMSGGGRWVTDAEPTCAAAIVAWVSEPKRPNGPTGTILIETGCFLDEVEMGGIALDDHLLPSAPRAGLLIFDGVVEIGPGPDPDVNWVGAWRPLTLNELIALASGGDPLGARSDDAEGGAP